MSVTDAGEVGPSPRVLHLIPSLEIGGTEGQLLEFVQRSSDPGQHVIVVSRGSKTPEGRNHRVIELGVTPRITALPTNLRALATFRRTVRRVRADLVHTYLDMSELIAFLATPLGVPIIATRRGPRGRYEGTATYRGLEGLVHRRARVLICNSAYLADRVLAEDRSPPPVEVIYNAVDTERFDVSPFPPGRPTVTVVANMHYPYKGHTRILHAIRLVRAEIPEAQLVLVGDGVERGRIERLAGELGLLDAVVFAGRVDDPRPFLRRAHVAALTSDEEGFPNALLEAMAMGRPVVATRVGGIPELVRDGLDGWLTSVDPSEIARRLVEVLGDRAGLARVGASARARAESFGWERLVLQTEAVYRRVLRPDAPSRHRRWERPRGEEFHP
jgi:glycosyltransferase involved in cell wall biosynthesis